MFDHLNIKLSLIIIRIEDIHQFNLFKQSVIDSSKFFSQCSSAKRQLGVLVRNKRNTFVIFAHRISLTRDFIIVIPGLELLCIYGYLFVSVPEP